MSIELVATEYAEGMLRLAIKKQALEEWMEELNQIKTVFEENPRFKTTGQRLRPALVRRA